MNKESAQYKAGQKFGQGHPLLTLFGVFGVIALLAIIFIAIFGSFGSPDPKNQVVALVQSNMRTKFGEYATSSMLVSNSSCTHLDKYGNSTGEFRALEIKCFGRGQVDPCEETRWILTGSIWAKPGSSDEVLIFSILQKAKSAGFWSIAIIDQNGETHQIVL